MDLNTKLIIKVQLNDEIRKMPIHNEDITYDELIIMMERVFKHKLSAEDEIIVKYKDEDGDLITISDDSDLAFAIESSKTLKLTLTIENNAKEEAKVSPSNLSGEDMVAIRKELQMIRDHTNRLLDRLVYGQGVDGVANTVTSGRTSVIGKDFQEVGGKEFDPLSTGNHSQSFQPVERSETGNSLGSGGRIEDAGMKSNTEEHGETGDIHRPGSAGNMIKNHQQNQLYNNMGGHPQMQTSVHNTQSTMSYGMGNTDMSSTVTGKNMQVPQHMLPNMGQSVPPNIGGQSMGVTMGGSNLPPPNLGGPNLPPNMIGSNMPPNMGGTNMPPSMIGSNMPPSNLNANVGAPNLPSNMGGQNISKDNHMHSLPNAPSAFSGNINTSGYQNHPQSDPSKPSYMNPSVPGQLPQQRQFYPNTMQPPRVSPNFQGPGNAMQAPGNIQPRPSYFNPQGNVSQFNPAMSQPNLNYGYPTSQK